MSWKAGLRVAARRVTGAFGLVPVVLLLLLGGCATTRVEQSRQTSAVLGAGEAMVILGRATYNDRETEESFTDCLADILSQGSNPIRLVSEDQFKDDLYPWFEARTAPTNANDLGRLFAESGVQAQIDQSSIRYLAWIEGDTVTVDNGGSMSCAVSPFGGGCFGMTYWEQDASYEASIWDLKNLTASGQISADANGTSYLALGARRVIRSLDLGSQKPDRFRTNQRGREWHELFSGTGFAHSDLGSARQCGMQRLGRATSDFYYGR